jgi:hypothetical protein
MTAEAFEELERRSRALLAGPALVAIPSTAVESP